MCLMAFSLPARPADGWLLAANRDEALDRPTAALHRWRTPQGTTVVAGRDLRDGGTWIGSTPGGRVAMLTNVRERDYIDTHREVSPLRRADDSILLDNDHMTPAEQMDWLLNEFHKAADGKN